MEIGIFETLDISHKSLDPKAVQLDFPFFYCDHDKTAGIGLKAHRIAFVAHIKVISTRA